MTQDAESTKLANHPHSNSSQSKRRLAYVGIGLAAIWGIYCLNGFRPPTKAIELSDLNTGSQLRQAIFGGSAMISLALLMGSGRLWPVIKRDLYWWIFGLFLLCSTLYSDAPSLTLKRSILYICSLLTAGFIVSILNGSIHAVMTLIGTLCSIAAGMSLIWWAIFPAEITTNPGRAGLAGISIHPNTLAPAMAIGVTILLTLSTSSRGGRAWRSVGLIACLIALGMAGSITSFLLCLVGVAVAYLTLWGGYLRGLVVILLGVVASSVTIMGKEQVSNSIFTAFNRDSTMSGRDVLWEIILEQIREYPVFGHGWGAFWYEGRGRDLVGTWNPRQSHNAYFDIVLDVGFVGLALLALAITTSAISMIRCLHLPNDKRARRAAAGSLGIGFGLLCVYGLQQSFLGKPDSFAFAAFLWICLSIHSQSSNITQSVTSAP